jgi:hypothetical protein
MLCLMMLMFSFTIAAGTVKYGCVTLRRGGPGLHCHSRRRQDHSPPTLCFLCRTFKHMRARASPREAATAT